MTNLARPYEWGNIPLYVQVASSLRRRIELEHWKPGDKISTIPELEKEFGVARVTVRRAIELLHNEGLISRQQGRGTFVAKGIKKNRWLELEVSLSTLVKFIEDQVPKFIEAKEAPAPNLGLFEGVLDDDYVYLKSIQSKNREPFGLVSVHLSRRIYDLAPKAFREQAALSVISHLDGLSIGRAHQTLIIGTAEVETARYLKTAVHSPTAEFHCVVTDGDDVAIYVAEIIYRGDCIKLDIEFKHNLSMPRD
jgi:GntR family transcriptional regulator